VPESPLGANRAIPNPCAMAAAEQEQQHFYLLLGNLLSPDNAVRKQAEVPRKFAGASLEPRRFVRG
uniref:Uncharacterized protein n=1 Tax=Anas platyrhynchos platyrhynchos TaxID=8840 RepID=A0A493TGB9_ANAPP